MSNEINLAIENFKTMAREDFTFVLDCQALWIKTKSGEKVRLDLNFAQKMVLNAILKQISERKPVRIVVPKARQHGISTFIDACIYIISAFCPNTNSLISADCLTNTNKLFQIIKRYHDNMIPELKPKTKKSNAKELTFTDMDSEIIVTTAGSKTSGRGSTIHLAHFSEVALYEKAAEFISAVVSAVPSLPNTWIVMESTGNGVGGYFYDLCMDAYYGKNDYICVFIPWYVCTDYSMQVPDNYTLELQESGEYGNEVELYNKVKETGTELTNEQLYWRRWKIANDLKYDLRMFRQEFPASIWEVFQSSGTTIFDFETLEKIKMSYCHLPIWSGLIEIAENGNTEKDKVKLIQAEKGYLKIWEHPDPTDKSYLVVVDTGGIWDGADYSIIVVYSRRRRVIAATIKIHIDAYILADYMKAMCYYYNEALLVIEKNKWASETEDNTETLFNNIINKLNYGNLYTTQIYDDIVKAVTTKIGFHTNKATKGLIVDRWRKFHNEYPSENIKVNDAEIIQEAQTYSVVIENGKAVYQASEGCHDDKLMAFGIALVVADELPYYEPVDYNPETRKFGEGYY